MSQLHAAFKNEDAARKFLEAKRWPDGPYCAFCGQYDTVAALPSEGALGPGWYHCRECRKKFTVRVGTLYERSHIPLHKWLYATHLLCSSKKGMSSHQLARMLDVTYKSAWFMAHRVREGMAPKGNVEPMGGKGQTVEADEMYTGKVAGKRKHPGAGGYAHKRTVVSLVQRGGQARSFHIQTQGRLEIAAVIDSQTKDGTHMMTDGAQVYRFMPVVLHDVINHASGEYVRVKLDGTKVHTNTVEGFFGLFKRGMIGTYQHCGEAHLQRYLSEFDFRYSNRASLGIDDATRTEIALKGIEGKRLTYRRTVEA